MPLPLAAMLSIAQIGSGILGGIMGNNSRNKEIELQERAMNQQNAIMQQQLALAERMNEQGLATQVDALGNITWYDKAKNQWQTILAPKQQELQDLSDDEQRQQLKIDAPMNRVENIKNATTRSKEGMVGESMRFGIEDMLRYGGVKANDLASSMRLSRERAVNQGFDDISNAAITTALRSGAGGTGNILSALAKARSKQIAATMGEPDIEGLGLAQDMNIQDMASKLSGYNLMQGRASNAPQMTFNPIGLGQNLTSSLAASRAASAQGTGQAGNMLAQAGAMARNPIIPNYTQGGPASILSSISNLLGAVGGDRDPVAQIADWWNSRRPSGTTTADPRAGWDWGS